MFPCICGKSFTRSNNRLRHQRESCSSTSSSTKRTYNASLFGDLYFKQRELAARKRVKVDNEAATSSSGWVQNNLEDERQIGPSKKRIETPVLPPYTCGTCNVVIPHSQINSHNRTLKHRSNSCVNLSDGVQLIKSALRCRTACYRVFAENIYSEYAPFFSEIRRKVVDLLKDNIKLHYSIKINMEAFGSYIIQTQEVMDIKSFNSKNRIADLSTDLDELFDAFRDSIIAQASEFEGRDSGWSCEKVLFLEVNINKHTPFGGSSYIKLPRFIERKMAVVNVKNYDQHCFAWAITSALFPANDNTSLVSSYPHYSTVLNLTGMNFPLKLRDIKSFENLNDISVNVYGLESKFEDNKVTYEVVGPLRYSQRKLTRHVNLLLITDDAGNSHYCWIKNLSRLVSSQISSRGKQKYFCDGCLAYFSNERLLLRHQLYDCNHVYTTMPQNDLKINKYGKMMAGNKLIFENFERQMKVPFVVYADFESVLNPIQTSEPNPEFSYTNKTFKHEPYSFAYLIKCSFDDNLSKFVTYRGADAAKVFTTRLEDDLKNIYHHHLRFVKPMHKQSPQEEEEYNNATICGICEKSFVDGDVKVRDHCHLTGKKRFPAAHSVCNLNFKIPKFIPILCHNMSGYDCHMFIKELYGDEDKVEVIAQTKENYVSFTKSVYTHSYQNQKGETQKHYLKMRFIDSFKFMSSSLEKLGANLTDEQCLEMSKHFPDLDKFNLMRKKGIFPYSFVDNIDKLNVCTLPTKNQFYDNLNEEHISDRDYLRAKHVWNLFECKSLGEYSDLYLKSDVLLLCDVFENFRRICLNTYKLDPAQYYSAPGLSWDAMLKYTDIELELLTDIDMLHFFKKGIRGGISQCSERKHIANNKFLPDFNPNEPSSFISYLDATNLYGHSMSQPLPTHDFEWLTPEEISNLDLMGIADNDSYGYVLEVDIHYPQKLHDHHADLPFLVERMIPPNSKCKVPKLIPNLRDKQKYIVHYKNLKQAINNGLIVMRTHRVLRFKQSCWMKPYIDLNTQMRNSSTNKSEKDFYKLMVNSVYGKTMENVDNRIDVKLVTHWENIRRKLGAGALIAKSNFKDCSIFSENLVAIQLCKVRVHYNKPLYLGFSVLELSKTLMYDFYYGFIKREFGQNASLLYTDTDSLILKVQTENFYDFINSNICRFDTSNYAKDNKFNIPVTRSVLGNFKDEFPNDPIISFYGTGAKAYHVQSVASEVKRAKGVKRSVIKNQLTYDDYKKIVENGGRIFRKMNSFRSISHDVYTEMKNKVALSFADDKRFIIPNTTHTLPWGHSDIEFYQNDPNENIRLCDMMVESLFDEFNMDPESRLDYLITLLDAEISE